MPRLVSKIMKKVARGVLAPVTTGKRTWCPILSGPPTTPPILPTVHPHLSQSRSHFPAYAYTSEESDEDDVCYGAFHPTTASSSVPTPIWSTEVVSTMPRGERIMALLDLLHEGGVVTMGIEAKATTKVLSVEVVEVPGGGAESNSLVEATKKSESKSGWMRRLKDVSVKKLKAAC
ncbi:hypothetical protein AAF712_003695 [Marasmius tenuissimus]|uniref:Uncharacterized protein n=1 Tax=Marasmius tenuissimus TaxID=585030 RepID=A0ABR3A5V9_9AGAR